jgi:glycerol-3-phosphate dehydrogenase
MDALPEVAAIARATLGWSAERTAHEVAVYRERAAADAAAARQPDDESAAEAREKAPDIVPMIDLGTSSTP